MISQVTFTIHTNTIEAVNDFASSTAQAFASGDVVMDSYTVCLDVDEDSL